MEDQVILDAIHESEARVTHRIDRMDTRINGRLSSLETFRGNVDARHFSEDEGRARSRGYMRATVISITLILTLLGILAAAGILHV